jgi:rubredoxin
MTVTIEKIPGGLSVDGLDLRSGKCGCTAVLPCCYSWSKVKRSENSIFFTAKTAEPDAEQLFTWGYTVRKDDVTVEVVMEDARDKKIFSGYYPPALEEWRVHGWKVLKQEGVREDFDIWRCSACKWLYKNKDQRVSFEDLPDDWKCPVCKVGKASFEQVA